MKIVVVGGCHIANYGIPSSEGFLQQWTSYLSAVYGETVQITCFAQIAYHQLPTLVEQHHTTFQEADLILLQMGNYELSYKGAFWDLFVKAGLPGISLEPSPSSLTTSTMPTILTQFRDVGVYNYPRHWLDWLKNRVKITTLSFYQLMGGRIAILKRLTQSMSQANEWLRPFASKIVMLTPFPSLNAVDHWLRVASKPLFQREAKRHGFTLLDVSQAVPLRQSYFLADKYHLNQRGHIEMAHCLMKSLSVAGTGGRHRRQSRRSSLGTLT